MNHHNYSFFGQKTGMLLDSAEIDQPCLYFRFLKKKQNGSWEKPSQGGGKNIKLNLLEMIAILTKKRKGQLRSQRIKLMRKRSTPNS